MILKNAKLILEDGIQEGSLCVENGKIAWISGASQEDGIDLNGMYLAPGFVDIHCHGSAEHWHFDQPTQAAAWHLQEGTTSLLCSMWRNAGDYSFERAIENVKSAMGPGSNIRGVHMEAPYVDADYGSAGGEKWEINRDEYLRLMEIGKGVIRQWTFDPLLPGAELFAQTAQKENIKLSVCYSKASPEQLQRYLKYGLRIGGHILCATGEPVTMFAGTREPGSDHPSMRLSHRRRILRSSAQTFRTPGIRHPRSPAGGSGRKCGFQTFCRCGKKQNSQRCGCGCYLCSGGW